MKLLRCCSTILFAIAAAALNPSAQAAMTITAIESGGNVVFTFSGDLDTTGKVDGGLFLAETNLIPSAGSIEVWLAEASVDRINLQAIVQFGSGGEMEDVGVGSGDNFAIFDSRLFLPKTYVSGSPINATLTFAGATFDSLGVDKDDSPYVWTTVGSGDTITMVFPPPSADPDNAVLKTALQNKIKKLKKKAKKLKKKGQKAKAKKLLKKVKKLKAQLAALG